MPVEKKEFIYLFSNNGNALVLFIVINEMPHAWGHI
jgi:hypothetical protein